MNHDAYDEPIRYMNNVLCIHIWQVVKTYTHVNWNPRWHYHKELEFLYMQEGSMEIRVQDQLYRLDPGDVFVVGSMQPHITRKTDENKLAYLVLHFDLQPYFDPALLMHFRYFSEIDRPLCSLNGQIKQKEEMRAELTRTILLLFQELERKSIGYEIAASLQVRQLLLTLLRHDDSFRHAAVPYEQANAPSLRPVLDYVNLRLSEKIQMSEVSAMMNMSYHYFSKYFKKVMGLSFVDYINVQRIRKAERLLLTEDIGITEISERIGIANTAHFYELFKRINRCTPREYMRRLVPERTIGDSS